MPTRSLSSHVFKWPDQETVTQAACLWARDLLGKHPEVQKIGYFGSYSRGDWGVGSDLDLVIIVDDSPLLFIERNKNFDTSHLPVPVDLLVYTLPEWAEMTHERGHFFQKLQEEIVWIK